MVEKECQCIVSVWRTPRLFQVPPQPGQVRSALLPGSDPRGVRPPPRPPHSRGQRGEVQRARAGGHGQAGPRHRPQHLSEEAAGLRGHRQKGGGRPLQDCPHQEHRQGCTEGDPQEHSSVFILLSIIPSIDNIFCIVMGFIYFHILPHWISTNHHHVACRYDNVDV